MMRDNVLIVNNKNNESFTSKTSENNSLNIIIAVCPSLNFFIRPLNISYLLKEGRILQISDKIHLYWINKIINLHEND